MMSRWASSRGARAAARVSRARGQQWRGVADADASDDEVEEGDDDEESEMNKDSL
jgi:hypothetical protein